MQSLDSIVLFPVDRLLKGKQKWLSYMVTWVWNCYLIGELRGSKGDLKRPFDRAWKEYHDKYSELERQKKKAAKEAGI